MKAKKAGRRRGAAPTPVFRPPVETPLLQTAIDTIASSLQIDRETVEWSWRYADRAGVLLPEPVICADVALFKQQNPDIPNAVAMDRMPAALCFARLLVAAMAAARPADAGRAIEAYQWLPMAFIIAGRDTGELRHGQQGHSTAFLPEQFQLPDPRVSDSLKFSPVVALASFIFAASLPDYPAHDLPASITFQRDLSHPGATIALAGSDEPGSRMAMFYGHRDNALPAFRVEATTRGDVVAALGKILQEKC